MNHVGFIFHQCPLEALFRAIDIEAFAVLASYVVQESPDVSDDIAVLHFDVAGFDCKTIA